MGAVDGVFETSHTPSTGSDDAHSPRAPFSHGVGHVGEEDVLAEDAPPRQKPGGYNSRIEQILYENPNMPIMITDAGKSVESGGRYIVYTIKTGVCRAQLLCMDTHLTAALRISRFVAVTLNSPRSEKP